MAEQRILNLFGELLYLMKKLLGVILLLPYMGWGQFYAGLKPPGPRPEKLGPELMGVQDEYEFGSVFSKDTKEFYFGVQMKDRAEIRYSYLENGSWSSPATLLEHVLFTHNDPFLSPDEQRLYFIGQKENDYDIWFVKRTKTGWSKPINAGKNINSSGNEYYMSFTSDGDMYFSSNRGGNYDIYKSEWRDGDFQRPEKLGDAINTGSYEADVFVAPDESYLIFCSTREKGFGQGDLYISFSDESGNWSQAVAMGESINTSGHELCPFVTHDGKYFLFTSKEDIYWVSTEIFMEFR